MRGAVLAGYLVSAFKTVSSICSNGRWNGIITCSGTWSTQAGIWVPSQIGVTAFVYFEGAIGVEEASSPGSDFTVVYLGHSWVVGGGSGD